MNIIDLKWMQELSTDEKVLITKDRLKEYYKRMKGMVYISYSGGIDSTVLLHIARSIYPDIKAVFSDTGLEFPEIKKFVLNTENVDIIKPKMTFKQVIDKYGYPVISKEQSLYIEQYRNTHSDYLKNVRWNGKNGKFKISEKWKFLVDAPFKISEKCCTILKKNPLLSYRKKYNLAPIVGTMASDSSIRERIYLRTGCNSYKTSKEMSTPLGFWKRNDIWGYVNDNNIKYCDIYNKGVDRTGCIFCLFGIHKESNDRFEKLKELHPKLYEYCMNDLGINDVVRFIKSRGC